jgi:hypothetical protein
MARSRSYGRACAVGAPLLRSCSRAGDGPTSPACGNGSTLGQRARREQRRLIGRDRRQASDQAERWSLVTRPVTRLRTISAAHALYRGLLPRRSCGTPADRSATLGQQLPDGSSTARPTRPTAARTSAAPRRRTPPAPCLREHPITRAITLIGMLSARCNPDAIRRISTSPPRSGTLLIFGRGSTFDRRLGDVAGVADRGQDPTADARDVGITRDRVSSTQQGTLLLEEAPLSRSRTVR